MQQGISDGRRTDSTHFEPSEYCGTAALQPCFEMTSVEFGKELPHVSHCTTVAEAIKNPTITEVGIRAVMLNDSTGKFQCNCGFCECKRG